MSLLVTMIGVYSVSAMEGMTHADGMEITRNLQVGSRGADVVMLQEYLISRGHFDASLKKGNYGPATRTAVIKLQKEFGIPQTGMVGPRTRIAVNQGMKTIHSFSQHSNHSPQAQTATYGSIVETAANAKNFTTLLAAATAAGLADTLKDGGPFTVFAPTDAAFAKIDQATLQNLLKPENKAQLAELLQGHIVSGRIFSSAIQNGTTLKTLNGKTLTFTVTSSGVMINGVATIATKDIIAKNGAVHVIDTVIR